MLTLLQNKNPSVSLESPDQRVGVSQAVLSRAAVVTLVGPSGYLYAVDALVPDQLDAQAVQVLEANRPSILFVLGIKCLRLAFLATVERATIFRRIR